MKGPGHRIGVMRTGGTGTSKPYIQFTAFDEYQNELGRGSNRVGTLRAALESLPADHDVVVVGVPALASGKAGELLQRLPTTETHDVA